MEQLLSVMRQSTGENGMFSGTGREHLGARSSTSTWAARWQTPVGIGLADVIASALRGNDASAMPESFSLEGISRQPLAPTRAGSGTGDAQPTRERSGALGCHGGIFKRSPATCSAKTESRSSGGREGRLSEGDLASDFVTGEPGSEAAFAVRDARGFEGYYKCNLFALEMTRRAGFEVPLIGRHHGWGLSRTDRAGGGRCRWLDARRMGSRRVHGVSGEPRLRHRLRALRLRARGQ
jgi:hypothetical protein